jgi:DNA-binding HxlR family transcriptional regulator
MTSRRGYGQFCPVSKAAEILAERWTLLVVRELLSGSRHFNELQRGIPLVSPTMLSERLRQLEAAGVIERHKGPGRSNRQTPEYRLTAAGQELAPVIEQLGIWGQRWAVDEIGRKDLEPAFLMWAMHRGLRPSVLGADLVVIAFDLMDAPANQRHWWLVIRNDQVDICLKHPGHHVAVTLTSKLGPLADVWLGHLRPETAVRAGSIKLAGEPQLVRRFREWCPQSRFAPGAKMVAAR